MLTGKQKSYLRSQAHHLRSLFQIGHNNLSIPLVNQIQWALAKRELIKVNVLQNADVTAKEAADFIVATDPKIEVAQIIGKVIVLYKPAKDEKDRRYSLKVASL